MAIAAVQHLALTRKGEGRRPEDRSGAATAPGSHRRRTPHSSGRKGHRSARGSIPCATREAAGACRKNYDEGLARRARSSSSRPLLNPVWINSDIPSTVHIAGVYIGIYKDIQGYIMIYSWPEMVQNMAKNRPKTGPKYRPNIDQTSPRHHPNIA